MDPKADSKAESKTIKILSRAVFAIGVIGVIVVVALHLPGKPQGGAKVALAPSFRENGVRISFSLESAPLSAKGLTGTVRLQKAGEKPVEAPLVYIGAPPGGRDGLDATLDLASVDSGTITFDVQGFTQGPEPRVTVTLPFKRNAPKK